MKHTKSIDVAFLVNSLGFGGAEKHTIQLFNSLDDARFRVALAYLKRDELLLSQLTPDRALQVWCADFGRGWDFYGLNRLSKWLRSFGPEVLVCINEYPLFYGHLARMLSGVRVPIVEIFHSTELAPRDDRKMRLIYRHLFNFSDRVIYVSEAQRVTWESRGIRHDRGACIHNGVDIDYFRDQYSTEEKTEQRARWGFSPTDFVIGICAELRPEKQHGDLLAAISLLKQKGMSAKCLIIGDGPCRGEIERKIRNLGLESDVAITGFQIDVRPFIAACTCLANVSSRVEAFSLAALEAMAMGKPMVMSNIGGASEQVVSGYNGYVYSRGDVIALSNILKLLGDVHVCSALGTQARQRVHDLFSFGRMLRQYESLFAAIAETNHDITDSP
jgi:glycosyltransferase involved in cell wall biosynthesis